MEVIQIVTKFELIFAVVKNLAQNERLVSFISIIFVTNDRIW